MQRLERFESTAQPSLMNVAAGSCIRVCDGALWLTLEGQPDDIWLTGGEQWMATAPASVWLSGEPHASFELLHPVALGRSDAAWVRLMFAAMVASCRAIFSAQQPSSRGSHAGRPFPFYGGARRVEFT